MKNLPNLRFLCGSHGAAVFDAKGKIEEYIAHRLERERQILEAVQNGAKTPEEIVEKVYIGSKARNFFRSPLNPFRRILAKISRDGLSTSDFIKFKR